MASSQGSKRRTPVVRLIKILIAAGALVVTCLGSFALNNGKPTITAAPFAGMVISGQITSTARNVWDVLVNSSRQHDRPFVPQAPIQLAQ